MTELPDQNTTITADAHQLQYIITETMLLLFVIVVIIIIITDKYFCIFIIYFEAS